MISGLKQTVEYLRAPAKYFWRWADSGTVIEWEDGNTICYRDDLVHIFRNFYCCKVPSFSAIILLLAACNKNFEASGGKGILTGLLKTIKSHNGVSPELVETKELLFLLDKTLNFLDIVSTLPDNLKKGNTRISLLQHVFALEDYSISLAPLKDIADELDSGRIDQFIFKKIFDVTTHAFKQDLSYLSNAFDKYKNVDTLALQLKTGLTSVPNSVDISLPDHTNADLFTVLLADDKTSAIAKLAQKLLAVMNIPLHVQGSSNMPLGGISDITNRGNYDKLLLSELAQEDEVLTARLVNNEALFLNREQPPENPKLRRTILLDTTIKMWGIPRVFAIAAALAISQNKKHHELIEAYALNGENYEFIDLYSKEGIITTLGKLSHTLDPGNSLVNCINELKQEDANEIFFITESLVLEGREFYQKFVQVKEQINYVIVVNREGKLKFYSYKNGVGKLLNTAEIDIDSFLSSDRVVNQNLLSQFQKPSFLETYPLPLYVPIIRISNTKQNRFAILDNEKRMVGVSEAQRLLIWSNNNRGAKELMDYIEPGKYYFGYSVDWFYVFINGSGNNNKFYKIDFKKENVIQFENIQTGPVNDIIFLETHFFLYGINEMFSIDYNTGNIISTHSYGERNQVINGKTKLNIDSKNLQNQSIYFGNNDSILFRIDKLHINGKNEFVFGKHILNFSSSNHITLMNNSDKSDVLKNAEKVEHLGFTISNPQHLLNKWRWKDGSEAIIDSSGFLHLKSSNQNIPEITLVMVLSRTSACWASDNNVCGSDYFTNIPGTNKIPVNIFHQKYIQPFINQLQ